MGEREATERHREPSWKSKATALATASPSNIFIFQFRFAENISIRME